MSGGGVIFAKRAAAGMAKPPGDKIRVFVNEDGHLCAMDEAGEIIAPEELISSIETALDTEESARKAADSTLTTAAAAAKTVADAALPKAGGTMTGKIVLDGDPTSNLHPATKQYVAAQIAAVIAEAPGALDTLKEISDQLATDESAVSALVTTVSGKESASNKDTTTSLGTSDTKYPSQKAVKTYVDAEETARKAADSTLTSGAATEKSARESADSTLTSAVAIVNLGTDWSVGENQAMYAAGVLGLRQHVTHGTTASPITVSGPTAKFSRREAISLATIEAVGGAGADGADQVAAVMGISVGQDPSETQTVGGGFFAINASNKVGAANPDACGLYAAGRITAGTSTKASAIGAFIAARRDVSTADASGIEITCHNRGTAGTYSTSGASNTRGIWLHATGTADSGCALNIGNPFEHKYKVGIGIPLQNGGAITEATLRDNGESEYGIDVVGTKSKAAIRIKSPAAGPVLIGHETLATTNALLEVMNDESGRDPLAAFGSASVSQKYSVSVRNSVGSARLGIAGTTNDFFTEAIAGDAVVEFTAGKGLWIGAIGKTAKIRVTEGGLSFYGVAPTTRAAAIAEPAESLASLKEKVNAIRTALKNIGITE